MTDADDACQTASNVCCECNSHNKSTSVLACTWNVEKETTSTIRATTATTKSLQQVQQAKHQTIRAATPQKLKLPPWHLQQQRRRQQQKHKPTASPTPGSKAKRPTIRVSTPQKPKLPPWHLQQHRRRQQQKHKPPASPTLGSKAPNHKSSNTAETEAPTMTSPTTTTTTTTKTQAYRKSITGKQSKAPNQKSINTAETEAPTMTSPTTTTTPTTKRQAYRKSNTGKQSKAPNHKSSNTAESETRAMTSPTETTRTTTTRRTMQMLCRWMLAMQMKVQVNALQMQHECSATASAWQVHAMKLHWGSNCSSLSLCNGTYFIDEWFLSLIWSDQELGQLHPLPRGVIPNDRKRCTSFGDLLFLCRHLWEIARSLNTTSDQRVSVNYDNYAKPIRAQYKYALEIYLKNIPCKHTDATRQCAAHSGARTAEQRNSSAFGCNERNASPAPAFALQSNASLHSNAQPTAADALKSNESLALQCDQGNARPTAAHALHSNEIHWSMATLWCFWLSTF